MSEQSTEESEQICPICGQEYDHKRTDRGTINTPELRSDATECKGMRLGTQQQVYVHVR